MVAATPTYSPCDSHGIGRFLFSKGLFHVKRNNLTPFGPEAVGSYIFAESGYMSVALMPCNRPN